MTITMMDKASNMKRQIGQQAAERFARPEHFAGP